MKPSDNMLWMRKTAGKRGMFAINRNRIHWLALVKAGSDGRQRILH